MAANADSRTREGWGRGGEGWGRGGRGQRWRYLVLSFLQLGLDHLQAVLETHRLLIRSLHNKTIDIKSWAEEEEVEEEEVEEEEEEEVEEEEVEEEEIEGAASYTLWPANKTDDQCQDNWTLAKRACQ